MASIDAQSLGSAGFRSDYGLRYAYVAGAMYKGIASKELVVAMGRSGLMSFLGTGGMTLPEIQNSIRFIQQQLAPSQSFGANLLCNLERPELEEQLVDLYFQHGLKYVEAAAFFRVTPSLVRWRLVGLWRGQGGRTESSHRILAKVSRPEVATAFMQPAPANIVQNLLAAGKISPIEAELSQTIPMAEELCVEADSGGHTDGGVAYTILPVIMALRDEISARHRYSGPIRIGVGGGIGTPHAVAASFIMGADFVVTGSINQCTVEAGTSDAVKDLLQGINVQDTDYVPAGDMFETGAVIQVVKRGLLFSSRAKKLHDLYKSHESIDDIDARTRQLIAEQYFGTSLDEVWAETRSYLLRSQPERLREIEINPKRKMAQIFKWYFIYTTRLALTGSDTGRLNYQIHCGPAMGSFNQWVKGTDLQSWRNRHVADVAIKLMNGAALILNDQLRAMCAQVDP